MAIHPGDHVTEYLEHLGWTREDLAERAGMPLSTVEAVCRGEAPITREIAEALSVRFAEMGIPRGAEFWLALQRNFDRAEKARHSEEP